jgi:hypothetical protein
MNFPSKLSTQISIDHYGYIIVVDQLGKVIKQFRNYDYGYEVTENEVTGEAYYTQLRSYYISTGEAYYLIGAYSAEYKDGVLTGKDVYDWHRGMDINVHAPLILSKIVCMFVPYSSIDEYNRLVLKDDLWLWLGGKSFTTHINVKVG